MLPISIALDKISKRYPGVVALEDVNLCIDAGEIVGLIGENGAGKSTLMKVLGGGIKADGGTIRIDGGVVERYDPAIATARGIAFVHQELNPFSNLDVTANILLGREISSGMFRKLDFAAMRRKVAPILERLRAPFGPDDAVAGLSLAELQMLEIARALSVDARLVIFDEPTSSLTMSETTRLLEVMRQLKAANVAVLFISHRLGEVESVADRVEVLRDGRNAGKLQPGEISRNKMISLMIGRDLNQFFVRNEHERGKPVLELREVATKAFPSARASLDVHSGEILGLAGLVGAGRTELALAAFGIDPVIHGEVIVGGHALQPNSVAHAIASGMALVPEDRKQQGLHVDFSVADNVALPNLGQISVHGIVRNRRAAILAERGRSRFGIKAASIDEPVIGLSGGNQQKVVLAKWLAMQPKVLIVDEPTRGIDVGAKAEVYRVLQELADSGVAILMISSDMEEVVGVSDRVAVMREGEITGILERHDITEHAVLDLAVR